MSEKDARSPFLALAVGGFLGGLVAGGNHAGFFGFLVLAVGGAFAAMFLAGHIKKGEWADRLGDVAAIAYAIPLPCAAIGMGVGKWLWG